MMSPSEVKILLEVRMDFDRYQLLKSDLKMRSWMCDQLHEDLRFVLELLEQRETSTSQLAAALKKLCDALDDGDEWRGTEILRALDEGKALLALQPKNTAP